jgi:hypothetical protein
MWIVLDPGGFRGLKRRRIPRNHGDRQGAGS